MPGTGMRRVPGGTTRCGCEMLIYQCPRRWAGHRYKGLGLLVFEEAGPGTGTRRRWLCLCLRRPGTGIRRRLCQGLKRPVLAQVRSAVSVSVQGGGAWHRYEAPGLPVWREGSHGKVFS